ncbi:hypothetical protein LY76DRAFT_593558 [Colletotrichum caudatum]|nr:hypothetical protein LY76DRAFT_593558 [Colletotrichum caudatum]
MWPCRLHVPCLSGGTTVDFPPVQTQVQKRRRNWPRIGQSVRKAPIRDPGPKAGVFDTWCISASFIALDTTFRPEIVSLQRPRISGSWTFASPWTFSPCDIIASKSRNGREANQTCSSMATAYACSPRQVAYGTTEAHVHPRYLGHEARTVVADSEVHRHHPPPPDPLTTSHPDPSCRTLAVGGTSHPKGQVETMKG